MTSNMPPIPILPSVAPLAAETDAWLCDVWGVLHNGARAFAEATAACRTFRSTGGVVVLISNAPRPYSAVAQYMAHLGIGDDVYDIIVTSGDVTRDMVALWQRRPLFHIGPPRDTGVFAGFDIGMAPPETAEVVVCSGLVDDTTETPDDYRDLLAPLAERGVPMICANPDIKVERGASLVWCAGGLAQLYEALGGKVEHAGKPHRRIYERTFERIAELKRRPVARERMLAIGDGLETDIKGAHAAGIRSVFVASRLHIDGPLSDQGLNALFAGRPERPVAALPALRW
ncbi:MAG: TIGR01459 family HAD-type hydrolase [Hyphomicrobiaceae bacterium]